MVVAVNDGVVKLAPVNNTGALAAVDAYHLKVGEVTVEADADNAAVCPEQIEASGAVIKDAVANGVTVCVILLEVTFAGLAQAAFEVISQVISSPLTGALLV